MLREEVTGQDVVPSALVPWQYHSFYGRGPALQKCQGWELPPQRQRVHTRSLCPLRAVSTPLWSQSLVISAGPAKHAAMLMHTKKKKHHHPDLSKKKKE